MLIKLLSVFGLAMVPLVELRGSVILGCGLGLEWYVTYIVSVLGNLLPVPFILLFIRSIFDMMKKWGGKFEKIALFFEEKGTSKSLKVTRYASLGLFLFVAIPLPGTGAWMGALIASLLKMRLKHSLISITLGVICAGLIMSLACYGVISGLEFLFS